MHKVCCDYAFEIYLLLIIGLLHVQKLGLVGEEMLIMSMTRSIRITYPTQNRIQVFLGDTQVF